MADIMESMLGAVEYDETVTKIQTWFYGTLMKTAWCCTCVSYCAEKAGVAAQTGKYENVDSMKEFMNSINRLDCTKRYGGGAYKPKRGDVVFMSIAYSYADCTHVGVVAEVDNATGYLKVISGNSNDSIRYTEYNYLQDDYVVAFGNITY